MFVGIRRWRPAVAETVTPNQLLERVSKAANDKGLGAVHFWPRIGLRSGLQLR